jgi:ADP-ribosylglycohydrolase
MRAMEAAKLSSQTTHGATVAVDGCRLMTSLVIGALQGVAKAELLAGDFSLGDGAWESEPLCAEIEVIRKGSYKDSETEIAGSGYAAKSLEAAIWAFFFDRDV